MAVAIRGSATARFYRTFHAWSRLGSVSHSQRRCFTPTSSIREANDAQSTHASQNIRRVRTSPNRDSRDGPGTRHNTQNGPDTESHRSGLVKTTEVYIPEDRLARMQKHPTYLDRLQATLDVKLELTGTSKDDGRRIIRVTGRGNWVHRHVAGLLLRHADDDQTLTQTDFHSREDHNKSPSVLMASMSSEGISLLQDNNAELRKRIQQTFGVKLDIKRDEVPTADGMRTVAITGYRRNIAPARQFLQSLHLDLEQPSQNREHPVETPLAKSPMPASTSSKPAQTASQTSPQTSPRSKPRSKPQSSPRSNPPSTPQASPQPSSQSSDPISSQTSPAILKHEYKATMRSVPSSVAILITSVPSTRSNIDSLRGMTVSSLSSITLEPEPIISFSIRGPSRTLDCITAGQSFTVNFLNAHARGASLADLFSRPHDDPSQPFRTIQGSDLAHVYESSHQTGPAIGGHQIPARFTCELLPGKSLEIGDHTVVFARVISIWRASDMRGPKAHRTFLGYAQAGYRAFHGNVIPPVDLETLEKSVTKASESDEYGRRRRIRIGNLPLTAQAGDVKQYLNESGVVFKHVSLSITDGQNPSYCFARFRSEVDAESAIRTLDGASFMGRSLKVSFATGLRSRQEEKAPGSQVFDEPSSIEPASTEPVFTEPVFTEPTSTESSSTEPADSDVLDAYWRMALDEDDEADVLEERAADQRALGEAEKPIDHPAANVEGDKQEK